MRAIGLDVHRDFCEVAVVEEGEVTSAGRIETTPAALELFAGSLGPADRVALEVTGNAWEIARIIEPHVERVLVVSPSDTGIRQARAKTDCLDARSSRTRAKKEIHACLIRRLVTRPKVSDLFGIAGRQWLRELEHLEAGLSSARHALVEASWSAVRQPDPLRAFYERIRARRGHQVAVVAASRKLACLFWCLLTCRRSEEQGRARDLVDERRDQAGRAGARAPRRAGPQAHSRRLAGERCEKSGRGRDTETRITADLTASSATKHQSQTLRLVVDRAQTKARTGEPERQDDLNFIPRPKAAVCRRSQREVP